MLVLISTEQQLVVEISPGSSPVANVDVYASFNDIGMPNLTLPQPGIVAANFARQGRYELGGAPPANYIRQYKSIYLINRHFSNAVAVTFQLRRGSDYYHVKKYTLATMEHISYIEGVGFARYYADGAQYAPV